MVNPVQIAGRAIATTTWGKAWCDHLETCRDFENRLPRGRNYVRHGAVIELRITPRLVTALVSGSDIYRVRVEIGALPETVWQAIRADCAGQIESLIELLQGRLSKAVMERLCRQEQGLFPRPADIRFACSCPDHAAMCKHVAAALYGVGARLDTQPQFLFRLRDVDEAELIGQAGGVRPGSAAATSGRILNNADVAALFGIDIASPASNAEAPAPRDARAVSAEKPIRTRQAAKTGTSAKPAGQTKSTTAVRETAKARSGADKPVKWWLKPKPGKLPPAQKPPSARPDKRGKLLAELVTKRQQPSGGVRYKT